MEVSPRASEAHRPRNMPHLVWRWMEARGLHCPLKRESLLRNSLKDLRDPILLRDCAKAVDRLCAAFSRQERICVYGDFDLDGSSGLALSVDALKRLGYKHIQHYQPKRLSEGYGLHAQALERLKAEGVDLVLTVDVGITAVEAVARAKEIGLDVIVTDHHLPKDKLPEAVAVVNPNAGDCQSGLQHLCGAGVAYYLMLALKRELNHRFPGQVGQFNARELLDLLVIGTLTDMVPLKEENRILSKHGLVEFQRSQRPGLRALLRSLGYEGKALSAQDLAIGIAPKLNALSRLEMGIMPVDVLLAESEVQAEALMQQVLHLNSLRKNLQQEAEEDADRRFQESSQQNFAWLWSSNYHKGVIGLVATRLSQNYGVCAFVGSCNIDGKISGSARVPEGQDFSLPEILDFCGEHLLSFGGHAQAAGFTLHEDKAIEFERSLQQYFRLKQQSSGRTATTAGSSSIAFDCEARLSELSPVVMDWLEAMGPFGQEFAVPVFLFRSVWVREKKELRGGHIKLRVQDKDDPSQSYDALLFSPNRRQKQLLAGERIHMYAELQWNYFAGRKSLQCLVRDLLPEEDSDEEKIVEV